MSDDVDYVAPTPPCAHRGRVEYKIQLDQEVCACGARRDVVDRGDGVDWRRTATAIDRRPRGAVTMM